MPKQAGFVLHMLLLLPVLSACSDPATEAPVVQEISAAVSASELAAAMLASMGGLAALEEVETLVMQGSGWRMHLGQIPATGAAEPRGELTAITETIDLRNGRAAFDNLIQVGEGFSQHRTEALTTWQGQYLGWGTTEGRPNIVTSVNGLFSWATHNTPEFLLRRNPVTIALSAATLPAGLQAEKRMLDGSEYWYFETRLKDETIGLYLDTQSSVLRAWSALDTETMWGDTNALYVLDDWRQVDGLRLPFSLEIRKDDGIYASLQYDTIRLNTADELAVFTVPADVSDQADAVVAANGAAWVPLQWNPVAEHVFHAVAFSHHSMVVEFPTFVAVVEAPYTEAQSLTLARLIEQQLGKPIRYVVPTHPHYDHTGGVRALVGLGATVLVAAGHEAELRMIVESPHSNPPDLLARNRQAGLPVGQVSVFRGMEVLTEGEQSLQLHEVMGIPHVSPKVLPFVPATGVLFQSDLFFGGPGPDATALAAAIDALALQVQQIVGGHGGVLPYSVLQSAVAEPLESSEDVKQ
jgi:glyoxylase-like metal-dependent hydrolase (beta-lactamase superfamily II)